MAQIEVQSFNHIAIWVSDLRKSADWYIQHLGLEEASISEDHIFLRLAGGQVLALFKLAVRIRFDVKVELIARVPLMARL